MCGTISTYNAKGNAMASWATINGRQARIHPRMKAISVPDRAQTVEGFMSTAWLSGERGSFERDMAAHLHNGTVRAQETCWDALESWPSAFQSLFTSSNTGKVVVRVGAAMSGACAAAGLRR